MIDYLLFFHSLHSDPPRGKETRHNELLQHFQGDIRDDPFVSLTIFFVYAADAGKVQPSDGRHQQQEYYFYGDTK